MEQLMLQRIVRGGWVLIVAALVLLVSYVTVPLCYPFLIAWLIALILNPIVQRMRASLRTPRWFNVMLCLTLFLASVLMVAVAVITRMIKEIYHLSMSLEYVLEGWRERLVQWLEQEQVQLFFDTLSSMYQDNPNLRGSIHMNLSHTVEKITAILTSFVSTFFGGIVRLLSSLPHVASIVIVILLSAFFISKDWDHWMSIPQRVMPAPFRTLVKTIWGDLKHALLGYLHTQLFFLSLTTFMMIVGLLVLRVEYAITIGLVVGFVDLLPYFGGGVVMIPWIMYCFAVSKTSLGIGLIVLYAIAMLTRQIMEPRVLASTVGIEPLLLLAAMFIGLQLFGVLGLLIGPTVLVLLSAMQRAHVFKDLWIYILDGKT